VFDVIDPFTLSYAGGLYEWGRPYYLTSDNDRLVINHLQHGFSILDVADPSAPFELARFSDIQGSYSILQGDLLTVCGYDSLVSIYSIANPQSPQLLGQINEPGYYFTRPAWDGDLLAMYDFGFDEIVVYDISDPANSERISGYLIDSYSPRMMSLDDGILYSFGYGEIQIFDVTTGPTFTLLSDYQLYSSPCLAGIFHEDILYCAVRLAGDVMLYQFDVSDPSNPQFVAADTISDEDLAFAGGIQITGTTLSISFLPNGIVMHDISTPLYAPQIAHWLGTGISTDVELIGDYLYVADDSRLAILDASMALPVIEQKPAVELPQHFHLSTAYPNPFNSTTTLIYKISSGNEATVSKHTRLEVFNIVGQKITTLE